MLDRTDIPPTREALIREALTRAAELRYRGTIAVVVAPRARSGTLSTLQDVVVRERLARANVVVPGRGHAAMPIELQVAQHLFPSLAKALTRGDTLPVITLDDMGEAALVWERLPR